MTDREELRRLAQAATPGPWDFSDSAEAVSCEQRYVGGFIPIANVELGWNEPLDSEQRANGEFIAAANPATVIELLDEIERLRAVSDAARAVLRYPSGVGAVPYQRMQALARAVQAVSPTEQGGE